MGTQPATVADFADRYMREVVPRYRRNPKTVERYLNRDVLPSLGRRRMDRVTGHDVQRIVFGRRDAGRPAAARAVRSVIKQLWDYGMVCGVAMENPIAAVPRRYLGRGRSRERVLDESELGKFLRSLPAQSDRGALASRLLLLTMARKNELRLARWPEIDFKASEWSIPAERTKTGKAQLIALSTQAAAILRELRAGQFERVEMVLPMGSSWFEPVSHGWLNARLKILERRARVPHFTVHDLRRTAATHLTELGWKPEVVEKALGHALKGVRGVYNRAEFADERRQMLQAWADWLDGLR